MLQLFQEFITPQQKKLAVIVEAAGGGDALENEQTMKRLLYEESALTAVRLDHGSRHDDDCRFDLNELQEEIKGDPNDAIEKNAELFDRKFDIQRRQIVEDIARAINQEGDRIILAMQEGPHARIDDSVSRLSSWNCMTFSSRIIPRTFGASGRRW